MLNTHYVIAIAVLCAFGCGCKRPLREVPVTGVEQRDRDIEALRNAYNAFNRGDFVAAVKPLDADIEWTEPAEFPGGGTYRGREEVIGYLKQSRAGWAECSSDPEQFVSSGNRIVVFVHPRVRPKGSNSWNDVTLADVYTFRGGKAIQMRAFADRNDALRWAGIEDMNQVAGAKAR